MAGSLGIQFGNPGLELFQERDQHLARCPRHPGQIRIVGLDSLDEAGIRPPLGPVWE